MGIGNSRSQAGLLGDATGRALATGECTVPIPSLVVATLTQTTQLLRLGYFTAFRTEPIGNVIVASGGTAAGATPSLVRMGVYSIDSADAGTLIASTPNDTSLLAGANTIYTKALSASFIKQAGQRYAIGLLVVTAATAPSTIGTTALAVIGGLVNALTPRTTGTIAAQADLPASFANAAVSNVNPCMWAALAA